MQDKQDIDFEKHDQQKQGFFGYDVMSTDETHTGYVTPNGGAGYTFTPPMPKPVRKRRFALITLITSFILILAAVMTAMFMGGMLFGIRLNYMGVVMDGDLSGSPAIGQMQYQNEGQDSVAASKLDKAQEQHVSGTTSAGEHAMSAPQVVGKVAASVVEITTETMINGNWVSSYVSEGAGSGVIISEDGYIVTNYHVVDGADQIKVRLTDGTEFDAYLLASDQSNDLALLWINAGEHALTVAQMGCSADLVVGEDVLAIGNPLGSLGGTVTNGIISATARTLVIDGNTMTLLQTNAAVNPGNSGGGLFNMAGQLIGVVNAKCSDDDVEGLGFAIPVDTVYEIVYEMIDLTALYVDDLREYGYVRGIVDSGLSLYDVASIQEAFYYFNARSTGVYVLESAYSEEIMYGDRIVSINGIEVSTAAEVSALLGQLQVGDTITLSLRRGGRDLEVSLTLQEYVPEQYRNNVTFE
ncbi:MAG: trypsin-like serine protease [Ruminococcaceae bacterium]|nr:trypsin-like serine protease [Oscillospiraceae bacterium]